MWRNARLKGRPRGTMTALILIVDDDPIQRRLLEAMARRFGYDAECVESGEAALARLEASDRPPINLLILDLVMPDLDGMGVLARMRQRDIAVARDRPDGAWLDRGRHLRHARGRDGLRRQAGRRRAPAGVDQERAARRCAGGRTQARHAAQRRRTQFPRHRHPRGIDGAHRPARRAGRQDRTYPS